MEGELAVYEAELVGGGEGSAEVDSSVWGVGEEEDVLGCTC
jgi:hypothetical protein